MIFTLDIKICLNMLAGLLRLPFTEDALNIEKGLELVSRRNSSKEIFDKKFSFVVLHKMANFNYQTVFFPKLFCKMCLVFHAWTFDDAITFEYLKS